MASLALLHEERFDDGVRRIARMLLEDALWRLEHEAELGRAHAVHQTRKRCKELRGLVRLARAGAYCCSTMTRWRLESYTSWCFHMDNTIAEMRRAKVSLARLGFMPEPTILS